MKLPRGKYIGEAVDEPDATEESHFIRCEECGGIIDQRDLAVVMQHMGPLPHPPIDKPQ
jgi:hypothetical protein